MRGCEQRHEQQCEDLDVQEGRVLLVREVKREDDEDERGPGGDEGRASEHPHEEVHRQSGEREAGKRREVVRSDLSDEVGEQVCRVVGEEDLRVVGVGLVPPERRARIGVMRQAEHVIAAFVPLLPEAGDRRGGVGAEIAQDRRAHVRDHGPEEDAHEHDRPERCQRGLREHGPHPSGGTPCMPCAGAKRRHARLDEELVRRE